MKGARDDIHLQVFERFYAWHGGSESLDSALDELLAATRARAAGLWVRSPTSLCLLGFRAVREMPKEVSRDFVDATRTVGVGAKGLAIVEASLTGKPAVGTLEAEGADGKTSSSWLARFGAVQSLAAPIVRESVQRGVLAISSPEEFAEGGDTWELVIRLANGLAVLDPPELRDGEQRLTLG